MRWEYKTIYKPKRSDAAFSERLSVLGRGGWELCGSLEQDLIFKRPTHEMDLMHRSKKKILYE